MVTVERNYLVKIITQSDTEDHALEEQAEVLSNIAFDWEMVEWS
jgi:hypothetical protein